jgi:hypothetical protein
LGTYCLVAGRENPFYRPDRPKICSIRIDAGCPPHEPRRGAHRAGCEVVARVGAVDELEALAPADEHHRVLAGVVAAAQRLDADRA